MQAFRRLGILQVWCASNLSRCGRRAASCLQSENRRLRIGSADMVHSAPFEELNASEAAASFGPVGALLRQQQRSVVERFSDAHERGELACDLPRYESLIPLTRPAAGEQYAFEVDLDACSGCKACVAACHSLNGLREGELWRSVGLLHGGTSRLPVMQHVTTACHHCVEPACSDGCPVGAYVKEPLTGIVRHLDDQCIGCQYCVLKCPYDVPKYLPDLGIVRKCDMCHSRLSVGQAPACVQSCPNGAIRITLVNRDEVAENAEANLFVPGAAGPDYTLPTTQYKSRRPLPSNMLPADYFSASRQHAHLPLVVMLVLTQMSVGAFLLNDWVTRGATPHGWGTSQSPWITVIATLGFGILGALASVLHLGRPWLAYRAVLGWRTSWLSREVIAFGLFATSALIHAGALLYERWAGSSAAIGSWLTSCVVVASGLLALFCSTMIYASTRRVFWNVGYTGAKFGLTALVLGASATLALRLIAESWINDPAAGAEAIFAVQRLCRAVMIAAAAKLVIESLIFAWLQARTLSPLRRTALLLRGDLGAITTWRYVCGVVGGLALPLVLAQHLSAPAASPWTPHVASGLAVAIFIACMAGELLERYLFFAAVVAPKMPGGPAA